MFRLLLCAAHRCSAAVPNKQPQTAAFLSTVIPCKCLRDETARVALRHSMSHAHVSTNLVRVSHHKQRGPCSRDGCDQLKLTVVGVLGLIDKHVLVLRVQGSSYLDDITEGSGTLQHIAVYQPM